MTRAAQIQWFKKGLNFVCTKCGACCKGPQRTVWVGENEVAKLAEFQGVDVTSWIRKFTQSMEPKCGKWQLRKSSDDVSCVFLTPQNRCSVHSVKPIQCTTYPFWPEHLISSFDWNAEGLEVCEGIHHGSGIQVPSSVILKEMMKTELNRETSEFDLDVFKAVLDQSDSDVVSEFATAFWTMNRRELRFETKRMFVVDTKLIDQSPKRSLIFKSSSSYVQSEVQLQSKDDAFVPDHSVLLQRPYQIMILGLTTTLNRSGVDPCRVAIIGAGCGALPMYLNHFFSDDLSTKIEAVDVDPEVLEIGKKWFGFEERTNLKIKCMDGLDFLDSDDNFDILIIDVAEIHHHHHPQNHQERLITAPQDIFHSSKAAESYWSKLSEGGLLMINVIGGLEKLRIIHGVLGVRFPSVSGINLPNGSIYFAWKTPLDKSFIQSLKSRNQRLPNESAITEVIQEVDVYHERFQHLGWGWLTSQELSKNLNITNL